jgi:hypothetical protein
MAPNHAALEISAQEVIDAALEMLETVAGRPALPEPEPAERDLEAKEPQALPAPETPAEAAQEPPKKSRKKRKTSRKA